MIAFYIIINIYLKRAGNYVPASIDDLQYSDDIPEPPTVRIDDPYFPVEGETIAEETRVEEGTGTLEEEASSDKVTDPTMSKYATAISKLKPLG